MKINDEQPLVSVLMTAYNREKYITEAIESVLASTYANIELIIVDDCSTDRTVELAKRYGERDDRVRVFVNEENLGDYPNRNKAASYANGKYLKYVDADDLIYPWGLELLINMMEQFPDAGWGLCSLEQDLNRPFPFLLAPGDAFRYNYFGPGLFHKAPLSSIVKNDAFKAVEGFSGKQHVGDHELWHMLAKYFPVVLMPHGIVWYREHEDQQMHSNRTIPQIDFKYTCGAYHFILESKDIPLSKKEKQTIITRMKKDIIKLIIIKILKMQLSLALDFIKMFNDKKYGYKNAVIKNITGIKEKVH